MKTIYCSPNFPLITGMELNQPMVMSENLLRRELERLIAEVPEEEDAIRVSKDLLVMWETPFDKEELLETIMQTDEIQSLLLETRGMMVEADEDEIQGYQEKTYYSFLIDLTNWLETK